MDRKRVRCSGLVRAGAGVRVGFTLVGDRVSEKATGQEDCWVKIGIFKNAHHISP